MTEVTWRWAIQNWKISSKAALTLSKLYSYSIRFIQETDELLQRLLFTWLYPTSPVDDDLPSSKVQHEVEEVGSTVSIVRCW